MSENIVLFSNLDDQVRYQPIGGVLPTLWTPAEITTAGWWDADDASTITEVTGVSNWEDKGSVGTRDITQGTGSAQPLYNSTTKTITFDGSNDYLSVDFGLTLSQPSTIFVVCKHDVISGGTGPVVIDGILSTARHVVYSSLSSAKFAIFAGTAEVQSSASDLVEHVRMGLFNGASSASWIDGTQDATGNAGSHGLTGLTVGSGFSQSASSWFNGSVREIILINSAISSALRETIEGYAAWKWDGINGNTDRVDALPALHPYKDAAPTI